MSQVAETGTAVVSPTRSGPRLARLRDFALLPVIAVLFVVGALVDRAFATTDNVLNVLQSQTELGLLVLAETLVLIAGRFDLSLEATIGLGPALGVLVPAWLHLSAGWSIPICLLVGVLVGVVNGLLIVKFRLSAFVLTLGMLVAGHGLVIAFTKGASIFKLPASFTYAGSAVWGRVPVSVWICAVLFAAGIVALGFLRHGRALYAIGGNVDAARAAGIRTDRVLIVGYVIAGLLAALAGLLYSGHYGSVTASQGNQMIFQVFAAAVIGGVSLDGGKGTIFGALCGLIVLGLIQNILTFAGVPAEWFQAINGVIIILALVLSRLVSGKAQD
ncbi:ABC transporter permease [Planosporangium mesophilum]|uniref:ABC transporter permease n=1 Tax=Planosporangium mesophilum TaxID=689768 RepID=UPI001439D0F8|nr:ABC transporter permease [Planosporangium mesophilum]NJC81401.1 ABC transporter permease [Planosporangium mesophilum]